MCDDMDLGIIQEKRNTVSCTLLPNYLIVINFITILNQISLS